jgi:hypothetical protein
VRPPSATTMSVGFPHRGHWVLFLGASTPMDNCPKNNWVPKNICPRPLVEVVRNTGGETARLH